MVTRVMMQGQSTVSVMVAVYKGRSSREETCTTIAALPFESQSWQGVPKRFGHRSPETLISRAPAFSIGFACRFFGPLSQRRRKRVNGVAPLVGDVAGQTNRLAASTKHDLSDLAG